MNNIYECMQICIASRIEWDVDKMEYTLYDKEGAIIAKYKVFVG